MEVSRQEPIFNLARAGYEALFNLTEPDNSYVSARVDEFHTKTTLENNENGLVIGIQVRHGDRHPLEFQYRDAYIPNSVYADTARETLYQTFNSTGKDGNEDMMAEMHSLMIVGSDDPDVYESIEFSHSPRAQDVIRLALKPAVKETAMPRLRDLKPTGQPFKVEEIEMFKRFEEESVGWEGGFFAGMFWSLGRLAGTPVAAGVEEGKKEASKEALRLRELVGRAYLMDLAVLGQSDRVVCAVSSYGCKLLAIMMGWERAIERSEWINVDGDFEWRGVGW